MMKEEEHPTITPGCNNKRNEGDGTSTWYGVRELERRRRSRGFGRSRSAMCCCWAPPHNSDRVG